jgi:hypothetical protein
MVAKDKKGKYDLKLPDDQDGDQNAGADLEEEGDECCEKQVFRQRCVATAVNSMFGRKGWKAGRELGKMAKRLVLTNQANALKVGNVFRLL